MEEVAANAGPGIQGGEDEEGFEHDGEVVPEVEPAAVDDLGKDFGHADGESGGTAGAAEEG